ncbi:MAG: DedA family membrane protein, partial [Candidatus Giovannonibacteria bacterium GW2011_GWA2_45_21]
MDILYAFIWIPLESETALYTVLFLILIISGFGVPIPEEATLLVGGYLAYLGFIDFWPTVYLLI